MRHDKPLRHVPLTLILALTLLLGIGSGCSQEKENTLPSSVRWVSESVEYAAICQQTYRSAWPVVRQAAAQQTGDWAVVLDVDETVLNNVQYEIELAQQGEHYTPETWAAWVRRREAPPVPGGRAFLDSVRSLGERAHVVFITNRDATLENDTIENLRAYGLWQDGDVILCRKEKADTKVIRRREVETGTGRCAGFGPRTIIALFGDQLADLMAVQVIAAPDSMRQHYLQQPGWGQRYFVLPNPMYGYWQRGYK